MYETIKIYHTSDLHNHLKVDKIKQLLSKERDNYILLDSGDALKGSNTIFYLNEDIIKKMNELNYTAMAMGNRELHYLRFVLINRLKSFKFPVLCANIIDLKDKIKFIKKIETKNLFIFGLTVTQYKEGHLWEKLFKLRFIDIKKAINDTLKLNKENKLVILLSHLGIKKDKEIASEFNDISIILGGHTHIITENVLKINNTYIIHSGCYSRYIHKIAIKLDSKRKIIDFNKELIKLI